MDMQGTNYIMNPEQMKTARAIVRTIFIILNNIYCIPAHMLWIFLLQPLRWVAEDTYWKIEGMFFRWLLSMVAAWSYTAGYDVVECGDDISDVVNKRALILFNHQSTSDVPLIMSAFNNKEGLLDNMMWIMDKQFKYSNFGVVSVAHGDFFIQAGKNHRVSSLVELKNHLKEFYIPRKRKWLVLFPEGGFLSKRKETSKSFAKKNCLPNLENVTLPRVGALKVILDEVTSNSQNGSSSLDCGIEYVIDVTIAYPKGEPLDIFNIFTGWRPPCDIIFHYKKFSVSEVPKNVENLTNWLYERYYEKEKVLQTYYDTGMFVDIAQNSLSMKGSKITYDPLEFLLRHIFYFVSTCIWIRLFLIFLNAVHILS